MIRTPLFAETGPGDDTGPFFSMLPGAPRVVVPCRLRAQSPVHPSGSDSGAGPRGATRRRCHLAALLLRL